MKIHLVGAELFNADRRTWWSFSRLGTNGNKHCRSRHQEQQEIMEAKENRGEIIKCTGPAIVMTGTIIPWVKSSRCIHQNIYAFALVRWLLKTLTTISMNPQNVWIEWEDSLITAYKNIQVKQEARKCIQDER